MLRSASVRAVLARCHSHSRAALFLLLVLLAGHGAAQQGAVQHAQHKPDAPPAGYITSFSCVGRAAGYYADINSGCQLYHMCDLEGRRFTHTCPNATLFRQRLMVCDHWYMVNCSTSELDYSANQLIGQRDKPFVSPEEQLHHREPVGFITRQQNPGSLQQNSWFPDVPEPRRQSAAAGSTPVADSEHPGNGVAGEHRSLDNISTVQGPSANRKARNRNINKESVRQTSNPHDSYSSDSFRTLPATYTNNPFFQSLLFRTMQTASQNPRETLMSSELYDSGTAQLRDSKHFTETSADARDSNTPALPQLSSPSKANDLLSPLGIPLVENIPTSFTQADTNINNPLFHPVAKTDTRPLLTSVIYPNIEQTSPKVNTNFDENEDVFGNTVTLQLLDHRRMVFIPELDEDIEEPNNYDLRTGNRTAMSISVPETPIIMHFRHDVEVTAGHNLDCPRCYPGFLVPGTCHPCVIIR